MLVGGRVFAQSDALLLGGGEFGKTGSTAEAMRAEGIEGAKGGTFRQYHLLRNPSSRAFISRSDRQQFASTRWTCKQGHEQIKGLAACIWFSWMHLRLHF